MNRLLRVAMAIVLFSLGLESYDRAVLVRSMSGLHPPQLPNLLHPPPAPPLLLPPWPPPPIADPLGGMP